MTFVIFFNDKSAETAKQRRMDKRTGRPKEKKDKSAEVIIWQKD